MQKFISVVFLTEQDDQKHILLFKNQNNGYTLLKSKVESQDFYSSSIAASKIIYDQLNNIDLRLFSFCKQKYLEAVDFEAFEYAIKNVWNNSSEEEQNMLRHIRNIQSQIWTQYFNECPIWNDDQEINYYYIIQLTQKDQDYLLKNIQLESKIFNIQQLEQVEFIDLLKAIKLNDQLRIDGRIVLHFNFKLKQHSIYQPPGGYLDTVSIYNGIFRKKHDNWNQYDVAQGQYPSDQILLKADFIIMPGNRVSVYDHYEWIKCVKEILNKAYNKNKKVKILGICFGLQILVEALEGKVQSMKGSFIYGQETLKHNLDLMKQFKLFSNIQIKPQTLISQAHGDEVIKYPSFLMLLSSSDSCKNEMFISKDERILGFQGHPEYSTEGMKLLGLAQRQPQNYQQFKKVLEHLNNLYSKQEDPFHLQLCLKFVGN